MKLQGKIWKSASSRFWLAEVRDLDLVTQGKSCKDAAAMLADAVQSCAQGPGFRVVVELTRDEGCTVRSNDDTMLVAIMLRRLRGREGLTVRDVSRRLKSSSPNAYAKYETGKVAPGLDTLSKLLMALNPSFDPVLKIA